MTRDLLRVGVLVGILLLFGVSLNGAPVKTGEGGVTLPIVWGDMGARLVAAGVIDAAKWQALYKASGAFTAEDEALLTGMNTGKLVMNPENAGYLLNLFWAVGLANKNPILEDRKGMMNPAYGGAQNFASTGGWTLARSTSSGQAGDAMAHYDAHALITLTPAEQALVERMALGIYRPCCDNPASFPDCNHGMALLGLLEMMASQGASEEEMWQAALAANEFWFPDTYRTIDAYLAQNGNEREKAGPQELLGAKFSSASGYANIAAEVAKPQQQSGGSCGT